MDKIDTSKMTFTDVRHLPIVKQYAKRIGLVETIDRLVDSQMDLSPGTAILAMVLDTLSGRTPLYRLTEFFEEKDTELLTDLKQFLVSMLCVDSNIPILGTTEDGNASDKTLNNELLTSISKHMARYGLAPGAYVYVADSAFVTEDNMDKANSTNWLSRLPATYNGVAG